MLQEVAPFSYGIPHPAKSIDFRGGRPGEGAKGGLAPAAMSLPPNDR
jgi:hypothetical protein